MTENELKTSSIKEILSDEDLSDILLVIDKKKNSVDALKSVDKNGNVETTPAENKNRNEFLHIGHNSDALDVAITAIKNFYSQARDPTHFSILKVPAKIFFGIKDTGSLLKELLKGNPGKTAQEFTQKYQVHTPSENTGQNENFIQKQNQNSMAKQNQSTAQPAVEQPQAETKNTYRFNESMIDWKSIEAAGISRQYLQDKGLLDGMLKGYKTAQLVPLSLKLGEAAVIKADARLSFQQSVGGPVVLAVHALRQEPPLQRPFFGHIFSDEDKKNLRESGNMGRSVELLARDKQMHPYLISIDKLTNELVATRADKVFIPDKVKGVELTDNDKEDLRAGKKIYIEGMTSQNNKPFDAEIQINADRRGIEFIFPKNENTNIQKIGGVELTAQQAKDLNEGKAIFVEDMKRADGELFTSFVKKDETTSNLAYTRFNPDSPEGAREIYIPKQIGGVELTGEERDTLRRGTPIFLDNMVNNKGEEFSSYVKVNTETGKINYAKEPDGFAQKEQFKIPAEVFGVTLNVTQRAKLQDGKAVLVEGMKGFDGKEFSSYVKVNANQGKLDYYTDNPDKPKVSRQNNQAQANSQGKENKAANKNSPAQDNPPKNEKKTQKSKGRTM